MFKLTGKNTLSVKEYYDDHSWITLTVFLHDGITGFRLSNLDGHDLAYVSGKFEYHFIEDGPQYYGVSPLVGRPRKALDIPLTRAKVIQGFKGSEVPDYYRNYILAKLDQYAIDVSFGEDGS